MDEGEIGGRGIKLKLKDFDTKLNEYAIKRVRKVPAFKDQMQQPAFYSPSVRITTDRLIKQRARERESSQEEEDLGGSFMKKLIDRRYEALEGSTT